MFNKNDPLIGAVTGVMKENELRRRVEANLCEELGIYSRKVLPREHQSNYDALLEQRLSEALHPNQQRLDVHQPEKDKLTKHDFKMLRSGKKSKEMSEAELAGPETGPRKTSGSNQTVAEEQLDELKGIKKDKEAAKEYIKKASHDVATKSAATGRYAERSNKEESDRKKTGDYSGYRQGRKDNETADKMFKKSWSRRKYMAKAVDKLEEQEQDSRNPLPPSGAKERIQNKLGTGAKSSVDPSYKHQGATASDREEMNKKMEKLDELSVEKLLSFRKAAKKASDKVPNPSTGVSKSDVNKAIKHDIYGEIADEKIKNKTGKYNPNIMDRLKAKIKANEEVELDEVSKAKVARYATKAVDDVSHDSFIAGGASQSAKSRGTALEFDKKAMKRQKSVNLAIKKLSGSAKVNANEDVQLDEAAKSKAQQRIMGMALAMRRGESDRGSDKVKKIATDMSDEEMRKFAKTKRKGLPDRVKKEEVSFDDVMEEIRANLGEARMKKIEELTQALQAGIDRDERSIQAATAGRPTATPQSPEDRDSSEIARSSAVGQPSNVKSPAQQGARNIRQALDISVGKTQATGPEAGKVPSPVSRENQMPADKAPPESSFSPAEVAKQKQQAPVKPGTPPVQDRGDTPRETQAASAATVRAPAAKQTFGQAFAAARKEAGGQGGSFQYGGKTFQTNVKGEKYQAASKLKPTGMNESLANTIRKVLKG